MKVFFVSALCALFIQFATAQNNPGNKDQVNPAAQSHQTMNQTGDDWDLYGGRSVEATAVPMTTSKAFSTKYPDQSDVRWYSWSGGYIAAYPGTDKSYQGVIYDKNGEARGTVKRVRYSTLSEKTTANMIKKYPDLKSDYIYEITTPSGKKTYVTNVKGNWSTFNDEGMYQENDEMLNNK